MYLHQVIFKLI